MKQTKRLRTKKTFEVEITRIESFTVYAKNEDEAIDLAFENTWTQEHPDTNKRILFHDTDTLDHTVKQVKP